MPRLSIARCLCDPGRARHVERPIQDFRKAKKRRRDRTSVNVRTESTAMRSKVGLTFMFIPELARITVAKATDATSGRAMMGQDLDQSRIGS